MKEPSEMKPYLIRALHEWCTDNDITPHLVVQVDEKTVVPYQHVDDKGQIILEIAHEAVRDLTMELTFISFTARFNGKPWTCWIPMTAVTGLYAKETGTGMTFQYSKPIDEDKSINDTPVKAALSSVKNDNEDDDNPTPTRTPPSGKLKLVK